MKNHDLPNPKKQTDYLPGIGVLFLFFFAVTVGQAAEKFDSPDKGFAHTAHLEEAAASYQLPETDPMAYDIDARSSLGITATLIDQYLEHALTSLRLIALSPATRSGIWPEIKPAMQTMRQAIPGAALYIEPDGGYYSVEQDYTNLNLADREYFEPLFSGEEIHGSLVYSRSTGKQAVLLAVPVFEGEQVTGAVALSVFLEDFQQLISESLNLPDNYLWYVIDEEGNTVLHPRTDYMFMNPAEQGSPSLKEATETILSNESGQTSYVFGGRNTYILYTSTHLNDWRVLLGQEGEQVDDQYMPEAYEILDKLKESIKQELHKMDDYLDDVIASFDGQFPEEHIARDAFIQMYEDNPYVISCALIDTDGVMVYLEPPEFHLTEGENIRDQENYFVMQKNKAPMLSNSFIAIGGYDAVSLQHPIIDDKGTFKGSVSLLMRPEVMIEELATPHIIETMYEPWVMEPEGRIIYEIAFDGTGKMLFLDYRYENQQSLLELGDEISRQQSGQSDYVYYDPDKDEKKVKMAIWDTIELHDTEWRIIVSYSPYQ
ncbi:MAG: cache domain-containing protein [Bacteroidales bacterium]